MQPKLTKDSENGFNKELHATYVETLFVPPYQKLLKQPRNRGKTEVKTKEKGSVHLTITRTLTLGPYLI